MALRRAGLLAGAVLMTFASWADAFVNPDFTPIHLVKGSAHIQLCTVTLPEDDSGTLTLTPTATLKGEAQDVHPIPLRGLDEDDIAELRGGLAGLRTPEALLFHPTDGGGVRMHIGRFWAELEEGADGGWRIGTWNDGDLLGTWDGGTDALAAAVRYTLQAPDPDIPSVSGAAWGERKHVATVSGTVHGGQPLDPGTDDGMWLHVFASEGDRILRWDAESKTLVDALDTSGMASRVAVWGQFSPGARQVASACPEGRVGVWTWEGDTLVGGETAWPEDAGAVTDLAVIGDAARSRLVFRAGEGEVCLGALEDGAWIITPLPLAEGVTLQGAGLLRVADITGTGHNDILAIHPGGGILFAGQADGSFAPGVAVEGILPGAVPNVAKVVDLDGDGHLDVIVADGKTIRVYQGIEGSTFHERHDYTGEFRYIPTEAMHALALADFNHDGRADLAVFNPLRGPHLFYNRGFFVFGFAEDLVGGDLPQELFAGQVAGWMVDFTGDGAEEWIGILPDGAVWAMLQDTAAREPLGLSLRMATGVMHAPLRVDVGDGDRSYGARVLEPGGDVFFGRGEPGPLFLRWKTPGGEPRETMAILEDGLHVLRIHMETAE